MIINCGLKFAKLRLLIHKLCVLARKSFLLHQKREGRGAEGDREGGKEGIVRKREEIEKEEGWGECTFCCNHHLSKFYGYKREVGWGGVWGRWKLVGVIILTTLLYNQ